MKEGKKLVKAMRYKIVCPVDMEWKEFNDILYTIQRESRIILNKTIQHNYFISNFQQDYKKKHGVYPEKSEYLGTYNSVAGYIYDCLKNEVEYMGSVNLSQTVNSACQRWKTDYKEILKGAKSIPSYRDNPAMDIVAKAVKLRVENGKYIVSLSLLNKEATQKLGRKSGAVDVQVHARDKSLCTILNRLISGEYTLGACKLQRKGKDWFFSLVYKFDAVVSNQLDKALIMGIDLGVNNPVYMSFSDGYARYKVTGNQIRHINQQLKVRTEIDERKIGLLQQGKHCGRGRQGRGRKARNKPVEVVYGKIANYRNTVNHNISDYVVKTALKHGAGVIQMENLKGAYKPDDMFLRNWTYYDLQQKITYKAEAVGIEVRLINPQYTSQRCSYCGHINKENRSKQVFKCLACGFDENADYNASKNISLPNIEELIQKELKRKKLKASIKEVIMEDVDLFNYDDAL